MARLVAAALALPEPGEARRGPQLPGPALLPPGGLDSRAEARVGGGLVVRLGQPEVAQQAMQLGLVEPLVGLLCERKRLVERACAVIEAAGLGVCGAEGAEVEREAYAGARGAKVAEPAYQQGERLGRSAPRGPGSPP